jgi:transcriptional regulator with GAF, ATPase, and Fis domain
MPTDDDLQAAMTALAGLLLDDKSLEETLRHMAQIACHAVPGCRDAGVTLLRDGKAYVSVHTNRENTSPSITFALVVRDEVIGELSFHSGDGEHFDAETAEVMTLLAEHAAIVAANALAHASAIALAQQLEEAMASRAVIEQAKGVLMARERCNPDEAFDMLRRASQRSNTKLRDIAQQIVDGVTRSETPG